MSTVERLEELLQLKDQELQAQCERNEELERQLHNKVDWMLHEYIRPDKDDLPVPRIEMRLLDNWDYFVESQVCLVLADTAGDCRTRVPLGYSKRSGAGVRVSEYPVTGELGEEFVRDLPRLLNEACFHSEQTQVPAFVVLDAEHRYRITSLRPLKMAAVRRMEQ